MLYQTDWVFSTWTKFLTCIVLLLHKASAVDLCANGFDVSNSSFQRGVVLLGETLAHGHSDPLSVTPLACATSCCKDHLCSAFFFINETCFTINCDDDNSIQCSPSSAETDSDSYWLRLRETHESPLPTLVSTTTPVLPLSKNYTVNSPSSTTLSLSSTISSTLIHLPEVLGSECNNTTGSTCNVNEVCSQTNVDKPTIYQCVCAKGYHRDVVSNSCIQDSGLPEPQSVTKTIPTLPSKSATGAPNGTILVQTIQPSSPFSPTVPPVEALIVSAGEERIIRWPQNEITVNAFVLPQTDNSSKDTYRYKWSLYSHHPDDTEAGEMVDIDSASLKLSKLRLGTYTFKVAVSADGKYGESFVNITVLPPERENQSPVAVAKPSSQEINQPNDLVIDGSGSTDDGEIVQFHWEQVSGPLNSQTSVGASDMDKPILVVKGLGPGSYRFKLTVTDSDGLTNDTYADAIIIKETDYPPKANAGSNIIINLPQTSVTLMGNASQDDKGIVSYEWTKKSDDKLTADMMGVRTPFLKLSNLQVGDYTFTLTVTDTAKQVASADVHVFVKPEQNQPPTSKAGPDKTVWLPIDAVTLDGTNSTDDQKIVSYAWTLVSGPNVPVIGNADQAIATVSTLVIGEYKFRLVVKDNEGLDSSSQMTITVKENPNRPPIAKAGGDKAISLPAPLISINGSASSDDKAIVSYLWTREKSSPAAGDIVPLSDHQAVLQLVNVVPGLYKLTLTVADAEGLEAHDSMSLIVHPDPYRLNLVELYLMTDINSFTENNQITLKDQLSLLLRKSSSAGEPNIVIRHVIEDVPTGRTLIIFYVEWVNKDHREPWPANDVVSTLKKLRSSLDVLEIQIVKFNPAVCQNNCSAHGVCDQVTKMCICDGFWMEDFFKSYFGEQETNCDWSVLYVIIIVFFGVVALGATLWAIVCYCRRYRCSYLKPKLKRHRYSGMESGQSDEAFKINEKMELIPKARSVQNSSLMQSESEFSSDELLFVNSKRATNGFAKKLNNGSVISGAKPKTAA